MDWFKKIMYGRYGMDQLSFAFLILSIPLFILSAIFNSRILSLLFYIPIIICYFRVLSKNFSARRQENFHFLKFWNPIQSELKKKLTRLKNLKTHKYYKCPECSQTLRVPRGKGNILITCPKCKKQFSKKS